MSSSSARTAKSRTAKATGGSGRRGGSQWTPRRLAAVKRQLLILGAALRANIQRALRGLGDEASRAWADEIAESSDLSIADSLADRRLPAIARDVAELGDTEAALQRIADGTYGACVACGYAIHPTRLARTPQAPRCRKCQQRFDRSEAGLRRARTGRASG